MSIKGKVEKVAHAVDAAFEALHPRLGAGHGEHSGEFVDVTGRLEALGGRFDAEKGIWHVPTQNRVAVDELLAEIDYTTMSLPPNFRAATPEDRSWVYWPPAWTDVFVSEDRNARLLVVGIDKDGKRQATYSDAHTEAASVEKYNRVAQLTDKLPDVDRALSERAHDDNAAAGLMLMRKMGFRPGGGPQKDPGDPTYGASTLERRHVSVTGDKVRFKYVGKHHIDQDHTIEDPELASVMRRWMEGKDGHERLFPGLHQRKLRELMAEVAPGHKPYDFRTHMGTSEALRLLDEMPVPTSKEQYRAQVNEIGDRVAEKLGNKREEALSSYIDPRVFDAWPDPSSLPSDPSVKQAAKEAYAPRQIARAARPAAPRAPGPELTPEQKRSARAKKAVASRTPEQMAASAKKAAAARAAKKAERQAREAERASAQRVHESAIPSRANLNRRADAFAERLSPSERQGIATYLRDGPNVDNALRYGEERPSARRVPDIDEAFRRADALEQDTQARRFVNVSDLFGVDDPFLLVGEQFTDPRYVMATTRTAEEMATPQGLVEMVLRLPKGSRPIPLKGGALMLPHGSNFKIVGVGYDAHGKPQLIAELG